MLRESRVSPDVAVLKPVSAAISIGSGGPCGAEGPVMMTGGAVGSLLGQVLAVTPDERKVLLAAGAAAGMVAFVCMAALFGASVRATLAAVLFAAEVTGHFDALVPLLITCAVADAVAVRLVQDITAPLVDHRSPVQSEG